MPDDRVIHGICPYCRCYTPVTVTVEEEIVLIPHSGPGEKVLCAGSLHDASKVARISRKRDECRILEMVSDDT
jgi:hypothetical protein